MTANALNCQKGTVLAIIKAKGDYVLALKGNQPLFYQEVMEYFDGERLEELRKKEGCWYRTVEKEHGGRAVREYYITEDVGWYSEKKEWEKLRSIRLVKKRVSGKDGSVYEEKRYYICIIGADAKEFERAARGHWKVENNLHWQLDFTFRYELSLDYENEAERLLSMLDINAVKEVLRSKGKSPEK